MSRKNSTFSLPRGASTRSGKPAFFGIYDLFGVELTQFVKVAESYTATVAPKEKII
jgi:hypothetical protein